MFKFKIFEIPDGKSTRTIEMGPESIDLGDVSWINGSIAVDFDKTQHFIRTEFRIEGSATLVCDRSLDEFAYDVDLKYEVLFKTEKVEETVEANGAIRNIDHASKQLDIEQDVLDTILVNLPAKKLHPKFLDENGNPLDFEMEKFGEPDGEDEDAIDPRWEALKKFKK